MFKKLLLILAFVALSTPSFSLALEDSNNSDSEALQQREQSQQQFCQKLKARHQEALKKKEKDQAKRQEKTKREREKYLEEKEEALKNRLERQRKAWDQKREVRLKKLEEMAQSDSQKEALREFQKTLLKAITVRREAKNEANLIFQEQVKEALISDKEDHKDRVLEFQEAMVAAHQKIIDRCEAGASPETLRLALVKEIDQIKKRIAQEKSEYQIAREDLKSLIKEKKAAFEAANKVFIETITEAKSELKKAFQQPLE